MDLSNLPGLFNAAMAAVALVAAVVAGLMRGSMQQLRDDLSDSRARVKDRDETIVDLKRRAEEAEADRAALARVVTGEAHLVAMTAVLEHVARLLDQHHDEAEDHWADVCEMLKEMQRTLHLLADVASRGLPRELPRDPS